MIIITCQRGKCIGCNYCVEMDYEHWRMTKKDGRVALLGSENKRGFHTLKLNSGNFELHKKVAKACPVGIIKVKEV